MRDLAAREKACCAFFTFDITVQGDQVWMDAWVVDDDVARQILDEYYQLPESLSEGAEALFERFSGQGLQIMVRDDQGEQRPATTAEHAWPPA